MQPAPKPRSAPPLTIVVIGASGDLAHTKIYPALFSLYCQDLLPADFTIFGFARSDFDTFAFRTSLSEKLTCRYAPEESCDQRMREFLDRCFYVSGAYDSSDCFLDLYAAIKAGSHESRRIVFYMAIPPFLFVSVAQAIANAGLVRCGARDTWPRVVIEKPFGRDRQTSDELAASLARIFTESQTFRIDHYLGKEVVQNLMVIRFANAIFEPLWNSRFVDRVRISWKEDIGVGARAGYFDSNGIIRDVIQSHLAQILALSAMEKPASHGGRDVGDAKVALLRCVVPPSLKDVRIGQYSAGEVTPHAAYKAEPGVAPNSRTATYARINLHISNERWQGVPFILSAGKGLNTRLNELRVTFKSIPNNIFCDESACPPANELVARIQPDEALYLTITSKEPGLDVKLTQTNLNLKYQSTFNTRIPDAYDSLLLDVLQNDRSLFLRKDELDAAWDIFTPVLRDIDESGREPELYPLGWDPDAE